MRLQVIYEVMLEEESKEVCLYCAAKRIHEENCMVYTEIVEYDDLDHPICQDCKREF